MARNIPTMSKRHFEYIAEIIRDEFEHTACGEAQRDMMRSVAQAFASRLSHTNDMFKWETFLRACGTED